MTSTKSLAHSTATHDVLPRDDRNPRVLLQLDVKPLSQDDIIAKVTTIYASLAMVETECMSHSAYTARPGLLSDRERTTQEWRGLLDLHLTLLHEHFELLMMTQHPDVPPTLREFPAKHGLPRRMWCHCIYPLLEYFRVRRPASQEYMVNWILSSYQMIVLLSEVESRFTDTWLECLGDLARYGMAVAEERVSHANWRDSATRWYSAASRRHPSIGRLYHHLGILELPSLRKLCLYAKSLTSLIPFLNGRKSLFALCDLAFRADQKDTRRLQSAEARIVAVHGLIFNRSDAVAPVASTALYLLRKEPSQLRAFGHHLAITNTAALFEFGSPTNGLFQQYMAAVNLAIQGSGAAVAMTPTGTVMTRPSPASRSFWLETFEVVLRNSCSASVVDESLSYVHVMLVCVHSLHNLRRRLSGSQPTIAFDPPVDLDQLPWSALAAYLNIVLHSLEISTALWQSASQGEISIHWVLPEDYWMRGLIWGLFFFPPGWFDGQAEEAGLPCTERPGDQGARAERVLWLGLYLALHTEYLHFDGAFSALPTPEPHESDSSELGSVVVEEQSSRKEKDGLASSDEEYDDCLTGGPFSDGEEDGFTMIKKLGALDLS